MKHVTEIIGLVVILVGTIVAMVLLFTFPTMWLWNWLMPYIFDLPALDFWQTVGLLTLINLLKGYSHHSAKK